jgi:hypothetical protein
VLFRSGYKGVSLTGRGRWWSSMIMKDGITYYLGIYKDPIVAAKVYDLKAKELFGEYARTNF